MVGTDLFRTFKGLSELKLYNINEDVVYNLPAPLDFSIDNGIQERRIPTRNVYGEQIFATSFVSARDPILRVVFPTLVPELLEFKTQRKFAKETVGLPYTVVKTVEVSQFPKVTFGGAEHYKIELNPLFNKPPSVVRTDLTEVRVSTTTDNLTENFTLVDKVAIPADVPSTAVTSKQVHLYAAIDSDGTTLKVENVAYLLAGDFPPDSFATISIEFTEPLLNLVSSLNDTFKMFATLVTTENQLVVLTAPKVKPSFQGSSISPSMEQIECIFYMHTPAGQCKAYDIIYTNTIVSC